MLEGNANFDAKHDLAYKTPLYLVHFDSETTDYCNHKPASPANSLKKYLININGLAQKVHPEEGRASVGGITVHLLDADNEITALLATDASAYFHRRKTVIKAGYLGLAEADLITITTGWVTGLKLDRSGLVYIFDVTDPQRWLQRKVFRSATEAAPTILQGNPVNIALAVLTSTGAGTNGDYDWLPAADGLGLDTPVLNVAAIEKVRDDWVPGDCAYMKFTITKPMKAKDFIEKEICQVLNLYPMVDGAGRYFFQPYKPPLPSAGTIQTIDESTLDRMPGWDANLDDLVTDVEFSYDYDHGNDKYSNEQVYSNVGARGPGKKPLVIKSKGLRTSFSPGSIAGRALEIIERRKAKIFARFNAPPLKIKFTARFYEWLAEAGDIVGLTHSLLPDIEAGSRGITDRRMEVIERSINWKSGDVRFTLLDTGFARGDYAVISPTLTVVSAAGATEFTVSTADAAKIAGFTLPEMQVCDVGMHIKAQPITILTVNTGTGVITCDDIGQTPAAGWKVQFADYDYCTAEQKRYGFIADEGGNLGVGSAGSAVKLLCHFDKNIKDRSYSPHVLTAYGNAQIDTGIKKIGSGSLKFDGSGDYVRIPDSADWYMGTGAFTIDFWVRFTALPSANKYFYLLCNWQAAGNFAAFAINEHSGFYKLTFRVYSGSSLIIDCATNDLTGFATGTWYHLAVVRGWDGDSNKIAVIRNGQSEKVITDTDAWPDFTGDLYLGVDPGGSASVEDFNGHMDELRIIKGLTGWTANFTPPATAHRSAAGKLILP